MTNSTKTTVVTIDGPAGAGKSTVSRALAQKLGFFYLDTGAMYRALTLKAIRIGADLDNEEGLVSLANDTKIEFTGVQADGLKVLLDGEDVSEKIRTQEVTNKTFYIARTPGVRAVMVEWQRKIAQSKNVVVEGRDAGTVVFPDCKNKFYLDADFDERARRRIEELKGKGQDVQEEVLTKDLRARDEKDFTREVGPLKQADDAVVIDSTDLSVENVVDKIIDNMKPHG